MLVCCRPNTALSAELPPATAHILDEGQAGTAMLTATVAALALGLGFALALALALAAAAAPAGESWLFAHLSPNLQ